MNYFNRKQMSRTIQELRKLQALNFNQKLDHTYGAIEKFCREVENPVISFSGGKDSQVVLDLFLGQRLAFLTECCILLVFLIFPGKYWNSTLTL